MRPKAFIMERRPRKPHLALEANPQTGAITNYALSVPVEHIISGDGGEGVLYLTQSSDSDFGDKLIEKVAEFEDLKFSEQIEERQARGSSIFYLSSSKWTATYSPAGPPPNWGPPPEDPSNN